MVKRKNCLILDRLVLISKDNVNNITEVMFLMDRKKDFAIGFFIGLLVCGTVAAILVAVFMM